MSHRRLKKLGHDERLKNFSWGEFDFDFVILPLSYMVESEFLAVVVEERRLPLSTHKVIFANFKLTPFATSTAAASVAVARSKDLWLDFCSWRRLRALPEESLDYNEVDSL